MKKIINWFRDLLYNLTDYAIIVCVIVAVATILIWRFNILFDIKIDKDAINEVPPIEISDDEDKNTSADDSKDTDTSKDTNTDSSNNSANTNDADTDTSKDKDNKDNPDTNKDNQGGSSTNIANGADISFNIPAGSFPSKIGDILIANGLIEDKKIFLTRCVELELDTKLKSGDFTIKKGTALDDIIKIIAK